MVQVTCPHCRAVLDAAPGIVSRCPHCGNKFTGPAGSPLAPPPYPPAPPGGTSPPKAKLALVLGIVGLIVPLVGIAALILALKARNDQRRSGGPEGIALAAVIVAVIACGETVLFIFGLFLAGGLFLAASHLGDGGKGPVFQMEGREVRDRLEVTDANLRANWERIDVLVESCEANAAGVVLNVGTARPFQDDGAASDGAENNLTFPAAGPGVCGTAVKLRIADESSPMAPGDFLEFCANGTPDASATNVRVTLYDRPSGTVAFTYTFTKIDTC